MKISIAEVKKAMSDPKFRRTLPEQLKDDIQKYEQNPGCPCNVPIYRNVLRYAKQQLQEYYPGQPVADFEQELMKLAENHFSVINCKVTELEERLKQLPSGRKQLATARWQDEITVIVNELDLV